MQIIGLDGKGRYLCAITPDELRRITTFSEKDRTLLRASTDGWGNNPYVNEDIELKPAWERLAKLKSNRDELEKAIRQLRACADILEPLAPLVGCDPPVKDESTTSNEE